MVMRFYNPHLNGTESTTLVFFNVIYLLIHLQYICLYPLVMTNIAIEHGHRNSGFSIENGGSFHSYVKLPEGNL